MHKSTMLCAQTRTNKFFESLALQDFQKIYYVRLIKNDGKDERKGKSNYAHL
jgi:hypothetical protein